MSGATGVIELDSGAAVVRIDPRLGGRIVSFTDRRGEELVEHGRTPASTIRPGDPFLAGGLGGFDDCLPGIAAERHAGPRGRSVADHGDVWSRPASVVGRAGTSVTLDQAAIDGGHLLRRSYVLEDATLRVDYALTNLTETALEAVWAAHPLVPLTPDAELDLGPIDGLRVFSGTMAAPGVVLDPRSIPSTAPSST